MPEIKPATLKKQEHLRLKNEIADTLSNGKVLFYYPLKITWLQLDSNPPINKILIAVGKRSYRLATTRNLIRRRVREAYRRNKNRLPASGVNLFIRYVGRQIESYTEIESAVCTILEQIAKKTSRTTKEEESKREGATH